VEDLAAGRVDLVTFTSSSTVQNFHDMLPAGRREALIHGLRTASIGPITTATAQKLGFTVSVTADEYTIPGLCDAVQAYFARP
jgi:uroporphyrinogen III methyltransferase/synthase